MEKNKVSTERRVQNFNIKVSLRNIIRETKYPFPSLTSTYRLFKLEKLHSYFVLQLVLISVTLLQKKRAAIRKLLSIYDDVIKSRLSCKQFFATIHTLQRQDPQAGFVRFTIVCQNTRIHFMTFITIRLRTINEILKIQQCFVSQNFYIAPLGSHSLGPGLECTL